MTKVLIDTNILVSAILSSQSIPSDAVRKAVEIPYQAFICEQSIEELRRVFNRKLPNKIMELDRFMAKFLPLVMVVPVPLMVHPSEEDIRDINDRPILRAAIEVGVDILISGDKDFLESSVTNPRIVTAVEFVGLLRK